MLPPSKSSDKVDCHFIIWRKIQLFILDLLLASLKLMPADQDGLNFILKIISFAYFNEKKI